MTSDREADTGKAGRQPADNTKQENGSNRCAGATELPEERAGLHIYTAQREREREGGGCVNNLRADRIVGVILILFAVIRFVQTTPDRKPPETVESLWELQKRQEAKRGMVPALLPSPNHMAKTRNKQAHRVC